MSKELIFAEAKKTVFFLTGIFMYAVAINMFLAGNNIAAGGFSGIAIIINNFVSIPIGTITFVMTLPFLAISFFVKGSKYTIKTLLSTFIYSLMINVTAFLPLATTNAFVAAVFGGVIYGFGAFLLVLGEGSSGGTDLLARLLLVKFKSMSLGKMFMTVDGFVVLLAIVAFRDIEAGLYAITTIFVCSLVTDKIINGFDKASICYIFTTKPPTEIADLVMDKLGRGVTLQKGMGMYEGKERDILMTVVRPNEVYRVKQILAKVDKNAFLISVHANEVIGEGFKMLD